MTALEFVLFSTIVVTCVQRMPLVVGDCEQRTVHNAAIGVITDGDDDHKEKVVCEWLINAPNRTIALTVNHHETECGYDFVFVYDGVSYRDTLLASFSGDITRRPTIRAYSGSMMVYLYSDASYVRSGFVAQYVQELCPFECSGHGRCYNGTCSCDQEYTGIGCQVELCPGNCSHGVHGHCSLDLGRCVCYPGYIGESCSLHDESSGMSNHQWYILSTHSDVFTPRTSHAGVYVSVTDTLWVYGGYSLSEALSDVVVFNFSTSQWTRVEPEGHIPAGRYSHSAVLWNEENIVVFGGQFASGDVTNQLWLFNISSSCWQPLAKGCKHCPRGVAGHAAALVGNKLYIHGGYTPYKSFTSRMWSFDLDSNTWSRVPGSGLKSSLRRLIGHSMVYHKSSNTLVVYGGIKPYKNTNQRSDQVLAFDVIKHYWTVWTEKFPLYGRSYHSASIFGNYMVIYGGSVHHHNSDERCYSSEIHAYHLGCRKWRKDAGSRPIRLDSPDQFGHLGHLSVKRGNNLLVIVGGFRGTVSGQVIGAKLSISVADTVAKNRDAKSNHCLNLTEAKCQEDPECVYCRTNDEHSACLHYLHRSLCTSSVFLCNETCLGALTMCTSCLSFDAWWPEDAPQTCGWCIYDQKCYPESQLQRSCTPLLPSRNHLKRNSSFLMSLDQCQKEDVPPGLTLSCFMAGDGGRKQFVSMLGNADFDDLDSVSLIKSARILFAKKLTSHTEEKEFTVCRAEGFIRPIPFDSMRLPSSYTMQLHVTRVNEGEVWLQANKAIQENTTVERISGTAKSSASKVFSSKLPVISEYGGELYYIAVYGARQYIHSDSALSGRVEISWNGAATLFNGTHLSRLLHPLTDNYLEPFMSPNCSIYKNCLHCLSNAACTWCSSEDKCLQRVDETSRCSSRNLVVKGDGCWQCGDYGDCSKCVENKRCAWSGVASFCVRRARNLFNAIVNSTNCPLPCEKLTTCSACSARTKECSWCLRLNRCFATPSLVSRGIYGQCVVVIGKYGGIQNCDVVNCSLETSCYRCNSRSTFHCGWCYLSSYPSEGRCVSGDFRSSFAKGGCKAVADQRAAYQDGNYSSSALTVWKWKYSKCPDLLECKFGHYVCDQNAKCINTPDSYECQCNLGYTGDGKQCNRTCDVECLHGNCSSYPAYKCDCEIGWRGKACNESCKCHFHSYCSEGPGKCDKCHHNSMGEFCQLCVPGSYGNATNAAGCTPCQCNGHGDISKHLCNTTTGECHCLPSYEGVRCEHCAQHYYGNPTNGGICYSQCDGLTLIPNEKSGSLGSYRGDGLAADNGRANCLWIITTLNKTTLSQLSLTTLSDIRFFLERSQSNRADIIFTVNSDNMNTVCNEDVIYVYDGIPSFVLNLNSSEVDFDSKLLAAYCGRQPVTRPVVAVSGVMVVSYRGSVEALSGQQKGFNASYRIHLCENCENSTSCSKTNLCECLSGIKPVDCKMKDMCSHVCASSGTKCDKDRGVCTCKNGNATQNCYYEMSSPLGGIQLFSQSEALFSGNSGQIAHMPGIAGATACYSSNNYLYLFGGYSLSSGLQSSMIEVNLTSSRWARLQLQLVTEKGHLISDKKIYGRLFHTAVFQTPYMIVIGGWIRDGPTDSVLHIDVKDQTVTVGKHLPVPLAGHSATLVGDYVYVVGGVTSYSRISRLVYRYSSHEKIWQNITTTGMKYPGCFAHTAVYNKHLHSVMVFGGYYWSNQSHQVEAFSSLFSLSVASGPDARWRLFESHMIADFPFNWGFMIRANTILTGWDNRKPYGTLKNVIGQVYRSVCGDSFPVTGTSSLFSYRFGQAIAFDSSHIRVYSVGGFDGTERGDIFEIFAPTEECSLVSPAWTKLACTDFPGCKNCDNRTVGDKKCSSLLFPCQSSAEDIDICQYKNCSVWRSCSECVSLPSLPDGLSCGWCPCRNVCVKSSSECHCESPMISKCSSVASGGCNWDSADYKSQCSPIGYHAENCSAYKSCMECAGTISHAGIECRWSETLQLCFSAVVQPLMCSFGQCGRVAHQDSQCLQPCSANTFCWRCIRQITCGWCAVPDESGKGVCLHGTIHGPSFESCPSFTNVSVNRVQNITTDVANSMWSFLDCPQEDECKNNHHTCRDDQDCTDTKESYDCHCKQGYKENPELFECGPSCDGIGGCSHGYCLAPNTCHCDFGYVGQRCEEFCSCNSVGQCLDETVDGLKTCIECRYNSQGPQCSECEPFFVKLQPGICQSCRDFCSGNSDICLYDDHNLQLDSMNVSIINQSDVLAHMNITNGPAIVYNGRDIVCRNCERYSKGETCSDCDVGYFDIDDNEHNVSCIRCMCNGHGTTCKQDGSGCDCQNSTKSDKLCRKHCYKSQCVQCVEGYLGNPIGGFPCYKDTEIGSDTLYQVDTSTSKFLAVIPQYTNVDVEVTLWVVRGQVHVELSTEQHGITQDIEAHYKFSWMDSSNGSFYHALPDLSKPPVVRTLTGDNLSLLNIDGQLRITLPHTVYQLHNTKVYISVIGATNGSSQFLFYFRQDSSEIDLFIFFSVFFSSFFLFLGLCVVAWKIKQRVDARREQQTQIFEMEERAKRPFAAVEFLCERSISLGLSVCRTLPVGSVGLNRRQRRRLKSQYVSPIVQQPIEDNTAVVGTYLIQLPGSPFEPLKLIVGTTLVPRTQNKDKNNVRHGYGHINRF